MSSEKLLSYIKGLKSYNSILREETYSHLINHLNSSVFSLEEKVELLNYLSSQDFLFYKINEGVSNDSVARSFSLLSMAAIVSDEPSLDIKWLIPVIVDYIEQEKDFRGQTTDLGWIHIYAHLGDFIAVLSANQSVAIEEKELVVCKTLERINSIENFLFIDGEEQRIAKAIYYTLDDNPTINIDKILSFLVSKKNLRAPENLNLEKIRESLRLEFLNENKNELITKLEKALE